MQEIVPGIFLYHGNYEDVIGDIERNFAVVSDPPYGINHFKGSSGSAVKGRKSLRRNSKKIIGDDTPFDPSVFVSYDECLLWGADHFASRLPDTGRWLAWDKTGGGRGPKDSFSDVEFAWINKPGNRKIFHYLWKGVCQDGEKGEKRYHPTQKPIALMEWCLSFVESDSIFDPFFGSGSTALACYNSGRKFIGCELDDDYYETAVERIKRYALKNPREPHGDYFCP